MVLVRTKRSKPHEPVQTVMVRCDDTRPFCHVTWLAFEFIPDKSMALHNYARGRKDKERKSKRKREREKTKAEEREVTICGMRKGKALLSKKTTLG